jgi:hypothetical protein
LNEIYRKCHFFGHKGEKGVDFLWQIPHTTGVTTLPQAMKSKRNLTRFTYETSAFQGWRLCLSRAGSTFVKYFPDKKFGTPKKSLAAAEAALAEIKAIIDGAKRVDGKLTPATVKKAEKLLKEAV